MSDRSPIRVERDGPLATIVLDRPEVMNAINLQMVQALHRALDELATDDELGALVLRGEGEHFAAGADLNELETRRRNDAFRAINASLFQKIESFPAPVVTYLRGYTLGGGSEMALASDIRLASDTLKIGQTEARFGIIPGAGATHRLPRLVGIGKAKEMIFTMAILGASEALDIGLVNRVVPDQELESEGQKLVERILKADRLAVRVAKVAINAAAQGGPAATSAIENLGQAILFESEEKQRRMRAFLEKQKGQ
ncbi:MAG: enoyl-CoA hydratase/isomerase family protein [Planctomycetota bacterium]